MAYRHSPIAAYSGDDLESRSGDDRPESVDLGDKPIYLLEHLATFTVAKETGIVFPSDGMRKLLQLEKTTGIWSQKMQLCLDRNWVLIVDYETGNVIEKFPASSIQEPTAFTSADPMEMYNNILVFIVGMGSPHSRSEMHIFQCQSISAVFLVEDLKQLRDGKLINHRDSHFEPRRPHPMAGGSRPNRVEYTRERDRDRDYHNNHDTDSELGGLNDETSSTSSEKYERDVTVLNHCFDDIEKFIARLQHAAAASRELERRRKNRKSKKKDPGEGLLTLRTRPPHEKDFIDIFSKFKLSFNLLAKLKAHIHDPNAPELVHFLFTPLALIVDASHDSCYDPNLPARVTKPLLTREAINLLVNCVTSKETELWRSLGDAWTVPRDQWKDGMVGAYHPVFFDGWSPDYPVIDEIESPTTPNNAASKKRFEMLPPHTAQDYGGGDYDYDQGPSGPRATANSPGLRDFSNRSEISVDSIERNGGVQHHLAPVNGSAARYQEASLAAAHAAQASAAVLHNTPDSWLDDLQARGAKVVQVTYPRTANNDKELTVVRGEYLEILDDSRKWWKARNGRGQVAHVPHTIVSVVSYENGDAFYNKKTDNHQERYQSNNEPPNADWARNKHIAAKTNGSNEAKVNNVGMTSSKSAAAAAPAPAPPVPPPMPLTLAIAPATKTSRSISTNSSKTEPPTPLPTPVTDDMQRELREVLTLFKEKKRNIEITKTPEVYIQQSSTPTEVQVWLKQKGFSENVQKCLVGVGGNELFAMKKERVEDLCGIEEGRRLASQLNVQRNVSGYKTTRSSELMNILAKVRQKSEPRELEETPNYTTQENDDKHDNQNGFQNGTESET